MTGATINACVAGWPITHSRSPLIHGYWLKRYGIDGSYTRRAVKPEEALGFFGHLREEGLAGCNVTAPHKEVAFAAATHRSEAASAMGAANTLWLEDGRLMADNTDAIGFIEHLRASAPGLDLKGRVVALLGAGGAARALVFAFLEHIGAGEIRIFNRTRDRAEAVRRRYGAHTPIKVHDWQERVAASREAALLVNATSLGMKGTGDLDMDVSRLDAKCVVADIVYVPLETPLLAAARARGLAAVDGLGMLLHQAVPGFQKWFGVKPQVTAELRALLVTDIEGR